jgi:hypothetical protein
MVGRSRGRSPRRVATVADAGARLRGLAFVLLAGAAAAAGAVEIRSPDGELYAFPTLLDEHGRPLATSTHAQWFDAGRLHVRITHRFPDGKVAVETARFAKGGELVQEAWSWEEKQGRRLLRAYAVDLVRGRARAVKVEDGEERTWDEDVKVERGKTFVGLGVPYAVKNLRDRLVKGEEVSLATVAFLTKPVSMPIDVKHRGREETSLAGRKVEADRFHVEPDLKGLEDLVEAVKGPLGAEVWLHHGTPPMLLRIRYRMIEANDPLVTIETLGAPRTPSRERKGGAE